MRRSLAFFALASVLLVGAKKPKPPAGGGAPPPPAEETFSPGFVDITFEEDDEDLEELMGSELMKKNADCSNIMRLEPAAMMGKLADAEITCLEDALREADKQTYKRRLSLLLMADAWAKGDKHRWDAIVKRHLEEIDRSDPDLCYKYALHLSKKGEEFADESIRWADVALENRTRWTGDTHVARVYALYRLKAKAAQTQWMAAEEALLKDPTSEELGKKRDDSRNKTKTMSREWLDYARSSGKDATVALQMCEAAAGTVSFCAES